MSSESKTIEYAHSMFNSLISRNSIINMAHTHFSAELFALPLKTKEHPRGVYTEQELYMILSVLFTFCFFDLEPTKSFALHKAAKALCGQLQKLVLANGM